MAYLWLSPVFTECRRVRLDVHEEKNNRVSFRTTNPEQFDGRTKQTEFFRLYSVEEQSVAKEKKKINEKAFIKNEDSDGSSSDESVEEQSVVKEKKKKTVNE